MEERDVKPKQGLGFIQLLGVLFVAAIGGAYGLEGCIKSGGSLWVMIALLSLPWLWGLPTALVVAELATSMPANSGADAWISCAFPPWFTIMSMVWTFMINRVDNSLYPNLFVSYLAEVNPLSETMKIVLKTLFVVLAAGMNVVGVELVGKASLLLMFLSLLPFFLMFLLEIVIHWDDAVWTDMLKEPSSGVDWTLFIPMIAWNISGFDSAGHIVEEVQTNGTTLVKALVALLFVTQLTYGLPIIAGISAQSRYYATHNGTVYEDSESAADASQNFIRLNASNDFSQWEEGYFVGIARMIANGEEYLPLIVSGGGVISAFGFMSSMLCTTSRALQGHALLGLFPTPVNKWLGANHPRTQTPVNAIMLNAVCCLALALASSFETLISIDSIIYSFRLLAIFSACVIVRHKHPNLPRPFRIPLSTAGLAVALALPMSFCVACIVMGAAQNYSVFIAAVSIVVVSFVVSVPLARYRFPDGLDASIVYVDATQDAESMADEIASNAPLTAGKPSPDGYGESLPTLHDSFSKAT